MNISIIGCGWLGLPLGSFLVDKGFTVNGSTTTPSKRVLMEEKGIRSFLIKLEPTIIGENVHDFFSTDILIINIPPVGRKRSDSAEQYPQQIQELASCAVKYKIKYVLFVSSTGIYGASAEPITEGHTPIPSTVSGRALVKAERIIQTNRGFHSSIMRLAGLVGGDRKAGRFLAGRTDLANGQAPVNIVHRDDCINIVYEIIRQNKWGKIYNICADKHPSREEFYIKKAIELGLRPPVFLEGEVETSKLISNEKVKLDLNYEFQYKNPMDF